LDARDVVDVVQLSSATRFSIGAIWAFFAGLMVLLEIWSRRSPVPTGSPWRFAIFLVLAIPMTLVFIVIAFVGTWLTTGLMNRRFDFVVKPDALCIRGKIGESEYRWTGFSAIRESRRVVRLSLLDSQHRLYLPKRTMSSPEIQWLRSASALRRRGEGFEVLIKPS
jgi:hypothetical protein